MVEAVSTVTWCYLTHTCTDETNKKEQTISSCAGGLSKDDHTQSFTAKRQGEVRAIHFLSHTRPLYLTASRLQFPVHQYVPQRFLAEVYRLCFILAVLTVSSSSLLWRSPICQSSSLLRMTEEHGAGSFSSCDGSWSIAW